MFRETLTDFLNAAGGFRRRRHGLRRTRSAQDSRGGPTRRCHSRLVHAVAQWIGCNPTDDSVPNMQQNRSLFGHHEDRFYVEAIRAGAKAYLPKEKAVRELTEVIRQVASGATSLGRDSAGFIAAAVQQPGRDEDPLTMREREVLQLMAEGKQNKESAALLGVSIRTITRENLMRKLNIHTTVGLVRYAVRVGLILP